VRAIVALNLHSYGSGRNPWGKPKPEYLEKVCCPRYTSLKASYLVFLSFMKKI